MLEKNDKKLTSRVLSIDYFRGALLMIMVVEHFLLYYGDETAAFSGLYCFFNDGISGWGAGGFLMMMGASQALSAGRGEITDNLLLFKKASMRSVYIFICGLVMLVLAFGWEDLWRWDILTLMGFSTFILFFCRFIPSWVLIAMISAIALSTPFLRSLPIFDFEWNVEFQETPFLSNYFPGMFIDPVSEPEYFYKLGHIIKGFFLWGEFPVFPWIIFGIIGFVAGRRIVCRRFERDIPVFIVIGITLVVIGLTGAYASTSDSESSVISSYVTPFCFYPDSFTMLLYQVGMSVIAFSTLFYLFDVKRISKKSSGGIARILKRTSNYSLTFYFLHYMLIGFPAHIWNMLAGSRFEMQSLGLLSTVICGITALVVLEVLIYYWEKHGGKYSLEWFLSFIIRQFVKDYTRER